MAWGIHGSARPRRARWIAVVALALLVAACVERQPEALTGSTAGHALDPSAAPNLGLTVAPDPIIGVNLTISTERFTWTPEEVGGPHLDGSGHAVLYVDGVRAGRIYTPWFHVDRLAPGTHDLRVVLVGNDYRAYTVAGRPVQDEVTVRVPSPGEPRPTRRSHIAAGELTVGLRVSEDRVEGWNVFVETTGFVWAPPTASPGHADGEGHARLFVDGTEVGRLYGPAFHLPPLEPGSHEILVSLVGNDRAPYAIDGVPVEAATSITVEGPVSEPDVVIFFRLTEGLVEGPERSEVEPGALVRIRLVTDVDGLLHLNGYDISSPAADGVAEITFTANAPGIFELELKEPPTPLGSIVVG